MDTRLITKDTNLFRPTGTCNGVLLAHKFLEELKKKGIEKVIIICRANNNKFLTYHANSISFNNVNMLRSN